MKKKMLIGVSIFALLFVVGVTVWRGAVVVDCFPYLGSIQEQRDREDQRFQRFSAGEKVRAKIFGTRCGSY